MSGHVVIAPGSTEHVPGHIGGAVGRCIREFRHRGTRERGFTLFRGSVNFRLHRSRHGCHVSTCRFRVGIDPTDKKSRAPRGVFAPILGPGDG